MVKSKIYQLRKYMAVTSSWQHDLDTDLYIVTIARDIFTVMEKKVNQGKISYKFYKDGNLLKEPLEYGARLEWDENDNDYWRCYTHFPAFDADHINSGGSYDPLEAVLLAFENDLYI